MILKGSQRSGAKRLAEHLLNVEENEHVEVHEVRGFVSQKLEHALDEMYAASLSTHCHQHMFSLSLSPPEDESVSVHQFEEAIHEIERKLGLDDQPRAIVFHEKKGRRHAHVVWSRIKVSTMTAVNMSHFKLKLQSISRELYLEHGWHMPPGLSNPKDKNLTNFTLGEGQQAKRQDKDARVIKTTLQAAWKQSDSKQAFEHALQEHGYLLARGDRRGFVVIDKNGEIYSLSRWTGTQAKELNAKLGDPGTLPSVIQALASIGKTVTAREPAESRESVKAKRFCSDAKVQELKATVWRHRKERASLRLKQNERWKEESRQRANRLPKGMTASLFLAANKIEALRIRNEKEIMVCRERDTNERQRLRDRQLAERRVLNAVSQRLNPSERSNREKRPEFSRHARGSKRASSSDVAAAGKTSSIETHPLGVFAEAAQNLTGSSNITKSARQAIVVVTQPISALLKPHIPLRTSRSRASQPIGTVSNDVAASQFWQRASASERTKTNELSEGLLTPAGRGPMSNSELYMYYKRLGMIQVYYQLFPSG